MSDVKAPLPPNEERRLSKLHEYDILDTNSEQDFDDITRLAAQICGTPIALVTLLDRERQWFKARLGVEVTEIPRGIALCAHTILHPEGMVITDLRQDPRFRDYPFVTDAPWVRFYAGTPLRTPDGHALGTLCVLDHTPRGLTEEQWGALAHLGRVTMTQIEMRRLMAERERLLAAQTRSAEMARGQTRELQTVADNVPVLIARLDTHCRYIFANRAYQDFLGVPLEQVIGHTMAEVLGGDAFTYLWPHVEQVLAGKTVTFEAQVKFRTIGPRTTYASYVPEHGPDGTVTGFLLSAMDLTQRRRTEKALRERTEVLNNVLSTIPHQVFWKDRALTYLGCNAHFARAAGAARPEDLIGKSDSDLVWTPDEAEEYRQDDLRVLETGKPTLYLEETYQHADGTATVGLTSKLPLHDAEGRIIGVLGISQDITERKALEAERERLLARTEELLAEAIEHADRDALTGLLNHRAFHKRLEEEAERARRSGLPLAIAVMDLDNFKFFNDAYGHLAGDSVLRQVTENLRRRCRPCDILARFGGDEFALLMPGLDDTEAERQIYHIVDGLSGCGFLPPGHDTPIPLNLSAGVAIFPHEAQGRLEALEIADSRLRLAKTSAEGAVVAAQQVRGEMAQKYEGFSMLDALVAAVDNKDRYTRRHSEDVLAYSLSIAQGLGMDTKTQSQIAVAALLHDVGKIGVPDAVLRKPGRLTDAEFDVIKQHPLMGAIIVGAVPGFEDTLDAVRHHHERWDGRGYPFGLTGEEIPLTARLMAVADAFSAMTTDRPYRKGMAEAQALTILRSGSGSQWDPRCVEAFLEARAVRCVSAGDADRRDPFRGRPKAAR